nr:Uncharacterised protein [Klebsiella pneumoniae]
MAPDGHVMINLRFSSQQRLTQLIKLMGVELAERRMVVAHKGQRLVHCPVNHRAVIVKGIVQSNVSAEIWPRGR